MQIFFEKEGLFTLTYYWGKQIMKIKTDYFVMLCTEYDIRKNKAR